MSSLQRKSSRQVGDVLKECLRVYGVTPGINRRLLDKAWGMVSGAEQFTVRTFYRDGIYYVTLSSSVVRSQLGFQKSTLLEKMNSVLSGEFLFDPECRNVSYLKAIVLR